MSRKDLSECVCGICFTGFKGVPYEEIYDTKCSCTDSKYHAGCANMIYEELVNNNKTEDSCPICRKDNIVKTDDINNFLLEYANREINYGKTKKAKIKFTNTKMMFRKLYVSFLKGKNIADGNMKWIQKIYNVIFVIWFVTIHILAHILYKDIRDDIIKCKIKENATDPGSDYLHDCSDFYVNTYINNFNTNHYTGMVVFIFLYIIVNANVNHTFISNVLEYFVFTLFMIIHLSIWKSLIKIDLPKYTTRIPSVYLFITYIILMLLSLFLISILRELNTINEKHNIIKLDNILDYYFKDGYDYEEELKKGKTDNSNEEKTDNLNEEKTDNLNEEKTDNLNGEKTENLNETKTDNLNGTIYI